MQHSFFLLHFALQALALEAMPQSRCDTVVSASLNSSEFQNALDFAATQSKTPRVCLGPSVVITLDEKADPFIPADHFTLRALVPAQPALIRCIDTSALSCERRALLRVEDKVGVTVEAMNFESSGMYSTGVLLVNTKDTRLTHLKVNMTGIGHAGVVLSAGLRTALEAVDVLSSAYEGSGMQSIDGSTKTVIEGCDFFTSGRNSPALLMLQESHLTRLSATKLTTENVYSHALMMNDSSIDQFEGNHVETRGHFSNALNIVFRNRIENISGSHIITLGQAAEALALVSESQVERIQDSWFTVEGTFSRNIRVFNSDLGVLTRTILTNTDVGGSHMTLYAGDTNTIVGPLQNVFLRRKIASSENAPQDAIALKIDRAANSPHFSEFRSKDSKNIWACAERGTRGQWQSTNDPPLREHIKELCE